MKRSQRKHSYSRNNKGDEEVKVCLVTNQLFGVLSLLELLLPRLKGVHSNDLSLFSHV